MLSKADLSIEVVRREFAKFGVAATFFSPTHTGLEKSILDAHEQLRYFLQSSEIHDFATQAQGMSGKVSLPIDAVMRDHLNLRRISLYRPDTKLGDPRFWVSRLAEIARPGNLIALYLSREGRLTLVNCSDEAVWSTRDVGGSPLNRSLAAAGSTSGSEELLRRLRDICRQGYVKSLRDGPTGVGYTLETLLGIAANSRRDPDFMGIEIKAGRIPDGGRSVTRTTLFSKTPDWAASQLRNGSAILAKYGYLEKTSGRRQLYCSLNHQPNSQGLSLRLSEDASAIRLFDNEGDAGVVWPVQGLEAALANKHRETFWVTARQRRGASGAEEFLYETVTHTRQPLAANLGPLIAGGTVEMDFTLSQKSSGGTRDHGYLFKIWKRDIEFLFPPPLRHDLVAQ